MLLIDALINTQTKDQIKVQVNTWSLVIMMTRRSKDQQSHCCASLSPPSIGWIIIIMISSDITGEMLNSETMLRTISFSIKDCSPLRSKHLLIVRFDSNLTPSRQPFLNNLTVCARCRNAQALPATHSQSATPIEIHLPLSSALIVHRITNL